VDRLLLDCRSRDQRADVHQHPGLSYLGNLNFLQVTVGYLIGRILVRSFSFLILRRGSLDGLRFSERRFGKKTRSFASAVFLFTRLAADGVRLFATAIPLSSCWTSNIRSHPAACSGRPGLHDHWRSARVIWVDAIQMFVYIGGALAAAAFLAADTPGGVSAILSRAAAEGSFRS